MWPAAPWDPSVRAMCGIDSSTWKCVARPLSPSTCRKWHRAGQPPPLRERRVVEAGAPLLPLPTEGHRPFPPGTPSCTREGAAAGRAGRTGQPQQGGPRTDAQQQIAGCRPSPSVGGHAPGRGRAGRTRPSSRASSGAGRRPSPPRPPPPPASGAGPAPRPSASARGDLPGLQDVSTLPDTQRATSTWRWSHLPDNLEGQRCVGDAGGNRGDTSPPFRCPRRNLNGGILVF